MEITRRILVSAISGAGLVSLQSLYGIGAIAAESENQQIESQDLQKRGEALRASLQQKYEELRSARMIDYRGVTNDAFTKTVLQYIPEGISFEDAETILRHAGFSIERPNLEGKPDRNSSKGWYAVIASIYRFDGSFLSRTSVYVLLLPKAPGEYTTVEKVTASLSVIMP